MTYAHHIRGETGRPTVSLQFDEETSLPGDRKIGPEGWDRLSYSLEEGTELTARIVTDKRVLEGGRFADSELIEIPEGWKIEAKLAGWLADFAAVEFPWDRIEVEATNEVDFYLNDDLVARGKSYTYEMPALRRPLVKAGLGVAGVAIATGLIGKWLNWW